MNALTRTVRGCVLLAVLPVMPMWMGCEDDAYCFNCVDSGINSGGAGGTDAGVGAGGDGGGVIPPDSGGSGGGGGTDGGDEACDPENDPSNCGECGHVCPSVFGAHSTCVEGVCGFACATGYHDLDGNPNTGCECWETNGGVEICDGVDNNCDGQIDEGIDLSSDPNCGKCNNDCRVNGLKNATARCDGLENAKCIVDQCEEGFTIANEDPYKGCPLECTPNADTGGVEVCNGLDDDCDGYIDQGDPGGGGECYAQPGCWEGVDGEEDGCHEPCVPGVWKCVNGGIRCTALPGAYVPTLEICDYVDNNCNGQIDEGFPLLTDKNNCGACGVTCEMDNAIGGCINGQCVIEQCLAGYRDKNGDPTDGCEILCPVWPPRAETCNGLDDDCDGVADNDVEDPITNTCRPYSGVTVSTPCDGAVPVCTGGAWRCNYGPGVEVDSITGRPVVVETLCDGLDGNCDGQVDETWRNLHQECDDQDEPGALPGECRNVGVWECNSLLTGVDCVITKPGLTTPGIEVCNGLDDDCDGTVDNDVIDDMVHISVGGLEFWIDRFEASRPDAESSKVGKSELRRCSRKDVLPWTQASHFKALDACVDSGARLCTAAELQAACESAAGLAFPYGNTYQSQSCNGLDYPEGSTANSLVPTGSLSQCISVNGVYDLSGNAAEWSSMSDAPGIYWAMGGSYETPEMGLECSFNMSRFAEGAILPELGFRCCRDTDPASSP